MKELEKEWDSNKFMTNETILKKAIEQAEDNGWKGKELEWEEGWDVNWVASRIYFMIIFSHSFAKHFWGKTWKKNLAVMVGFEEPLLYLEKFLK